MFDHWTDFTSLWEIQDARILTYGIGGAAVVIIVDAIVMKVFPAHMYDDGGLNEKMFKNRSIPHIVWLTLLIAFSEEILFRGIVQQQFGLEIASIVFALLHFRYLSKKYSCLSLWFQLVFFLGLLYEWTGNLFVPVMTHFVIDLVFACQIRLKYRGGMNMEEMSRMKRKKEQLTNIHDDDAEKIFEEEVQPSDDSHFPTREDFHEYKKAAHEKKVRNPLFTTLAIIFPIIVVTVFFLLIYYTSKEINHNNNQDVYNIDSTSSADTDPVPSALVETKKK
ncbi:hypothetical protein BsIDN1_40110 [Bacillus safensis]|uniref:CAAX prenyl protease 2/Lysostaphin resistance protein A-like domain-containing protein n=1 Tax=Bacillus safensis TaxID=561879 RepID=A0A5S9MBA6_BACIA|nr:hypothetical protein BsIDN1_40110 [Bacillus safensis]